MTVDAVRNRTKTVTRRRGNTWRDLKAGDRLTLIEKGMGLPKGAKQVVLAEVEIVDVRVEPITNVNEGEVLAEGFGWYRWTPDDFICFWLGSHGYNAERDRDVLCRRIEWRYLS